MVIKAVLKCFHISDAELYILNTYVERKRSSIFIEKQILVPLVITIENDVLKSNCRIKNLVLYITVKHQLEQQEKKTIDIFKHEMGVKKKKKKVLC